MADKLVGNVVLSVNKIATSVLPTETEVALNNQTILLGVATNTVY